MELFLRRNRDVIRSYIILLIVMVLFATYQKDFLTKYGPQSIFNQVITLCVVALSQTLVILTGGIDLSVGSMVGLTNSIAATIMFPFIQAVGGELLGIVITVIIVFLAGILGGLFNGLIIVFGRLQPIIVTLASWSIFTGIAMYIRPSPGGRVAYIYTKILTGRAFDFIPVSAIILSFFIIIIWIPFRHTKVCQSIYAVGGNEYSAYVSGINVNRTKLIVYILSGFFSACAGLLLTAQTASGDPIGSSVFTLNSIAAVILGGTAISGGKGSYLGSIAGSIILSLILGLLIFWSVPSFYQTAVQGGILIIALKLGLISKDRGKKLTAKL